jgi:hypothetical protein
MPDQKDFKKEIKNTSYALMLNEYPQEFTTSILKPLKSSPHSSETTYQSTVIIPCVKGISEKCNDTGKFSMSGLFSRLNKRSMEH